MKITRYINAEPTLDKSKVISEKSVEINSNPLFNNLVKSNLLIKLDLLKSINDDDKFNSEIQKITDDMFRLSSVLSDPENSVTGIDKNGEFKIRSNSELVDELNSIIEEEKKLALEIKEKEDADKKAKIEELKAEKEKLFGTVKDKVELGLDFCGQVATGQVKPNFFESLFESLFESIIKGFIALPKNIVKGFWHLSNIKENPKFDEYLKAASDPKKTVKELEDLRSAYLSDGEVKDHLKLGQIESKKEEFDEILDPKLELDSHVEAEVSEEFEEVGKITDWDSAFNYGYLKLKQRHGIKYDKQKAQETLEGLKAKYPDNPMVVIGALKYGGRRSKSEDNRESNSRISNMFLTLKSLFKDYNVTYDTDEGRVELTKGNKLYIVDSGNEKLILLESESFRYASSDYDRFLDYLKKQLN